MRLLRDTYVINKIDTSGIEYQMRRKNDIQEKQNAILNDTKDRVDISLNEYESLKSELKRTTKLLECYQKSYNELGKQLKISPEILLRSKVIKCEVERVPLTLKNNLYVVFELEEGVK